MLELWVDTPEIQRSVDLYEEFIKCCIEDATSEVFIRHNYLKCMKGTYTFLPYLFHPPFTFAETF